MVLSNKNHLISKCGQVWSEIPWNLDLWILSHYEILNFLVKCRVILIFNSLVPFLLCAERLTFFIIHSFSKLIEKLLFVLTAVAKNILAT